MLFLFIKEEIHGFFFCRCLKKMMLILYLYSWRKLRGISCRISGRKLWYKWA
jgi:hypothetical protein